MDESFTDISLKKAKKSERVESILLGAIVPISKQDIAEKVPDISVKTIELVLSKMLKENKIKKIGTYKDARYMRNVWIWCIKWTVLSTWYDYNIKGKNDV